ncbi:CPBP family intramembrane glutamic endopeptidase [Paenibacillus sp. 481]|uniref:CPBP family intramembrane glutamic endopeptidase n=1 Tax=Paenibacillus sp. 481 TaxID=2835869 RepID=UPI001E59E85F|nr:CPBP family intramembrane glutamic endopeptidase [Paenibacillus sp. 481]UHA72624.1 CPBP family intramembrane metalloprotease [Paenibacillus sp. 481]
MIKIRPSVAHFFNVSDPKYVQFLRQYDAKGWKQITFYISMALFPGLLAYIGVFHLRESIMLWTGMSSHYAQYTVLVLLTAGWHIFVPLLSLRYVDNMTLKQSLCYLGFRRPDLKGLLLVFPLLAIIMTLLSIPYLHTIYPPLYHFFNSIPWLAIESWHIYVVGYYDFPFFLLLIGIIGNFIGEEMYFRGYILHKLGSVKGDWIIVGVLFNVYHFWQAPINWAYIPFSIFIPFELLVKLRKNIYGAIALHLFTNFLWGTITYMLAGVR